MVLTLISRSPWEPGFLAPIARDHLASLASASGGQDHTILRPQRQRSSCEPLRPSHPALNVRDDREAPLMRGRDAQTIVLIFGIKQENYFFAGDWTGHRKSEVICPTGTVPSAMRRRVVIWVNVRSGVERPRPIDPTNVRRVHLGGSAVIREQLDGVAETAHRIFADAFEIEIAFRPDRRTRGTAAPICPIFL